MSYRADDPLVTVSAVQHPAAWDGSGSRVPGLGRAEFAATEHRIAIGDLSLLSPEVRPGSVDTTRETLYSKVESMIELLKGFPDNVAAFAYHGHVTKADYDQALIPDFEDRLRRHKKLRIYVEIAPDLEGFEPGAVWEDQKLGFGHFFDWERCAIVTDVSWAKHLAKFSELFRFLWPGKYRAFSEAEADKAREWIAEAEQ